MRKLVLFGTVGGLAKTFQCPAFQLGGGGIALIDRPETDEAVSNPSSRFGDEFA